MSVIEFQSCPHCGKKLDDLTVVEWGGWSFNENSNRFLPGTPGDFIHFTGTHGKIISALLRRKGKPVNKDHLYGILVEGKLEADWPEPKIIDVVVSKIRRLIREALGVEFCETVWGVGYNAVAFGQSARIRQHSKYQRNRPCACGHNCNEHLVLYPRDPTVKALTRTRCKFPGCLCKHYVAIHAH